MSSTLRHLARSRLIQCPTASSTAAGTRRAMADGTASAKKSGGSSSFLQRISAFGVGIATASCFYYIQLHQDIWDSTVKIEKALSEVKLDAIQEAESLRHRVSVLEKEVAILKSKV